MPRAQLTPENFRNGFLIDADLMAGVTEKPDAPGAFLAYVLKPGSGEYLGYQEFTALDEALAALNAIPREWTYESAHSCGEGKCGNNQGGNCRIGGCGKQS
jgi:hypothetical protein